VTRVFVSHAREDAAIAERVAAYLEQRGLACWIAPRDVPAGMEYGAAILQGIEESAVLLLLLSERSNESQFVHREVERAVSKAKPVLPLRIREIAPSGALEFFLSQAQWVDAWQPPIERHLEQLVQAIEALCGQSVVSARRAPTATVSPPRPGRRWQLLAGVGLAAAIAVALAWYLAGSDGRAPAADFLAGAWCQPMSGEASATWRFTRLADDRVGGSIEYSHSTETQRFDADVTRSGGRLSLAFTAPADLVGAPPLVLVEDGENRLRIEAAAAPDPNSLPPEPLTRCPG